MVEEKRRWFLLEHKDKEHNPDVLAQLTSEEANQYEDYGYKVSEAVVIKKAVLQAIVHRLRSCDYKCEAGSLAKNIEFRKLERMAAP